MVGTRGGRSDGEVVEDPPIGDPIDLDDGTWEDLGPDGRWRPSLEDRTRAAVVLLVALIGLACLALLASLGDEGDDDVVAASTSTTEATTTTTTAPPDPSSLDGEPASARCQVDDRSALPLRERGVSTVLVLNGTSRGGYAGATTDALAAKGYSTVVPDNAGLRDGSEVRYAEGFCAEAERLATDLGLPRAEVGSLDDVDLPVVAGRARLVVILGPDSL